MRVECWELVSPGGRVRGSVTVVLREARVDDISAMWAIETAAGELFRPLGMDLVADDDPPSPEFLRTFIEQRRAWIVDSRGEQAGYLLVDGCDHVEQVSVHPRHARRRLGSTLIEHLTEWASDRHLPAVTLTTYRRVPWSGPYYESLGFRWLDDHEVSPGLSTLRDGETARGLDRWLRGCMRRDLPLAAMTGALVSGP